MTTTTIEMCECRKGTVSDEIRYSSYGGSKVSRVCATCATWLMSLGLKAATHVTLR